LSFQTKGPFFLLLNFQPGAFNLFIFDEPAAFPVQA